MLSLLASIWDPFFGSIKKSRKDMGEIVINRLVSQLLMTAECMPALLYVQSRIYLSLDIKSEERQSTNTNLNLKLYKFVVVCRPCTATQKAVMSNKSLL